MVELHALAAFFDTDEAIVIRMRHEPHQAAARLLVALGCGWIVDPQAEPCAHRCGREECIAVPVVTIEEDWIGYRHSVAEAQRRADRGDETLEICGYCECEVDVATAIHSPRCKSPQQAKLRDGVAPALIVGKERKPRLQPDGAELLRQMDAGERIPRAKVVVDEDEPDLLEGTLADGLDDDEADDEPALEEAAAPVNCVPGDVSSSAPPVEEVPAERMGPDGGTSSTATAKRKPKPHGFWTFETCVAAFQEHHRLTGAAPKSTLLNGSTGPLPDYLPAWTIVRKCGGYAAVLEAAGFEAPARSSARGTRSRRLEADTTATRSERDPQEDGKALEAAASKSRMSPTSSTKPPAVAPSSRSDTTGWIKVDGTGLAYRNPDEAYLAAIEIEADGERVAAACREDGNDERADQAVDQAHELAEKIRMAARAAEERASGSATSSVVAKPEADPEPEPEVELPPPAAVALEVRETAPGTVTIPTPLTRLLAKIPAAELEQAVDEYDAAIAQLQKELALVEHARTMQQEAA